MLCATVRIGTLYCATRKNMMAVSALLVVFFAALTCSTDAAITGWDGSDTTAADAKDVVYTFDVPEGTVTPTKRILVTAKVNPTADITYTLVDPTNGPFEIKDSSSGAVTIKTALDFETAATHTFKITATDGTETNTAGTLTPTAIASVTINVMDVLTFAKKKDSVCVQDGAKEGTEVASVKVTDTTNTVTYAITTGNTGDVFTMTGDKIKVATGKTTDKDTTDSFDLVVTATDAPETATFTLTVTIGDCSAASVMAPIGLLTILMALMVFMS